MSELSAIAPWCFRETVSFGANEETELPNGNTVDKFVEKFHRKCAKYRVSPRYILANTGVNTQVSVTLAIRHFPDVEYDSLTARYRGKDYLVTHVLPDETHVVTYDLIFLKDTEKNG